jgi:hypothetical protein
MAEFMPKRSSIADQTLDELEGVEWGPPEFDSFLVTNVHRLRRVPLKQFRVEDLRLVIGQQVGLEYLVPIALDHLEANPLAEGDYYPGDLLAAVARVPEGFWRDRPALVRRVVSAIDGALVRLRKEDAGDGFADELIAARERLMAVSLSRFDARLHRIGQV